MTKAPRTAAIAEFIAGFRADDLPAALTPRLLELVADGSGCLLAAANPAWSTGRRIGAFVRAQGGAPEASVVGQGFRTGTLHAALANGTMGYACDFEPHHPEAILHPIAVMIPSALAIGERVGARGPDFLAATALGCEVEYRVSMALGPAEQYALGFHPSAVCGGFGATATACHLLGLNAEAVTRALGLAACQASGLMAWESDPSENSRPFQMGMAARNGLTAALLAADGFGGPIGVFDHGHSVFKAFSRNPEPELLTRDLGHRWDGIAELAIKPYPCVSFLHPALDALFELIQDHDLQAEAVEEIAMRFPRSGVHCIDANPLKSHCAQYVLAVALARGRLEVADLFVDRRQSDPLVRGLADRIRVEADDGALEAAFPEAYATELELRLRSGRSFRRRNDIARGYPEAPMSAAEIEAKFDALLASVGAAVRGPALKRAVQTLLEAPDLRGYAELLRAPIEAGETGR
jgi:2-methylcitrate dehydratase PrpD